MASNYKVHYEVYNFKTRVLHIARIDNVHSFMFCNKSVTLRGYLCGKLNWCDIGLESELNLSARIMPKSKFNPADVNTINI